jgi:23S rRNA (uracil1939-C5)-methyltransferase
MNALLAVVREVALAEAAPPPWDVRSHKGFWRHLLLREAAATGERLVGLYTATADAEARGWVTEVQSRLARQPGVVGVLHIENDGVADVARGVVRSVVGRDYLEECLGTVRFRLSATSFFQTSTAGAVALYDTVAEAVGRGARRLVDLYCGTGAIGLYLASRFEEVLGIEENADAVGDARQNAAANQIGSVTYFAGKVEDALPAVWQGAGVAWVVDPPRVGLHPRVVAMLAAARADTLVYVACHPASLGRDAAVLEAGGWSLAELWPVDLFPQTAHVEVVARFVPNGRCPAAAPSDSSTDVDEVGVSY